MTRCSGGGGNSYNRHWSNVPVGGRGATGAFSLRAFKRGRVLSVERRTATIGTFVGDQSNGRARRSESDVAAHLAVAIGDDAAGCNERRSLRSKFEHPLVAANQGGHQSGVHFAQTVRLDLAPTFTRHPRNARRDLGKRCEALDEFIATATASLLPAHMSREGRGSRVGPGSVASHFREPRPSV
jgi:hypothetical protein